MKRRFWLTLGLIVTLILSPLGLIMAQESQATVVRQFDCGINGEDSGIPGLLITTNTWSVVTPNGNTNFHCVFTIPAHLRPAHTMIHQDFLCSTLAGLTTRSRAVTTKSSVHLTCQINPSTPPYEPPPGGD